ncbi:hypothetical protein SCP_0109470 [Sparassis crispa]|uniref:Uncharacterized protein n=1 Tax=Sparassis crispa TaxID=139825 RepID=A0A401G7C0_9APHY|nr:hypothetical protein SCP_0109470 [Sparassis crispa]GBE78065.1 hypothetical protein SCP_0109470 [Sparassis crispa]
MRHTSVFDRALARAQVLYSPFLIIPCLMAPLAPRHSSQYSRARYGPPALRIFTQGQSPQPRMADIAIERFKQCLNIRHDNDEQLDSSRKLHPHFCLSTWDRQLACHEALTDIEDAAVGAARLADIAFIGIGIRPEWLSKEPLTADTVKIDVILTCQFEQYPQWKTAIDKIQHIVQEEIGVPHILGYSSRLDEVTPGPEYALDLETRRICSNPIRLATKPASSQPRTSSSARPLTSATVAASSSQHRSAPSSKEQSGSLGVKAMTSQIAAAAGISLSQGSAPLERTAELLSHASQPLLVHHRTAITLLH